MKNLEKIKEMNIEEMALFLNKVICREISITPKCTIKNCEEKYCNKCTEKWLSEETELDTEDFE